MDNIKKVIKWIYRHTKPYLRQLIVIIILGALMALCTVGMAVASKRLIDNAVNGEYRTAAFAGTLFFVIILAQIGISAILSIKKVKANQQFSNDLRLHMYNNISEARWDKISAYHSDDILTRMTSDINVITEGIMNVIPSIITMGIQLLAAFVILFIYDKFLAVFALVVAPVSLFMYRIFSRKQKSLHIKKQEAEAIYRGFIHECLQNINIIKVFSQEENSGHKIKALQDTKKDYEVKWTKTNVKARSMLSIGYYISYMFSFAWGAYRLSIGALTYGTLTAFFQLVGQVQGPFINIARSIPSLIATDGSANRLMELEALIKEENDHFQIELDNAGIKFEDMDFEYKEDKSILKDVSAIIKPGEIIGVLGSSGEGKTTLIRLILSLLSAKNGHIYLFNESGNCYNITASCRKYISYVPQGNTLFSGTIAENMRIGFPKATDEEIIDAIKTACAWDFVKELEKGIYTEIGERGLGLSEGQAQRLTIARAFIRKTPILIFDEATSALDERTEIKVLQAVKELEPKRTCLIITHRPAIHTISDRILKIVNGTIIEEVN